MIKKKSDLLKNHIVNGEFIRIDFIVRLLAIEHYYDRNNFGITIYNKMQKAKQFNKRFIDMIKSFQDNGFIYKEENCIILNRYMRLAAGAHRLACCMYFGIDEIPCIINLESAKDSRKDSTWLKQRLTDDAVNQVMKRKQELNL